MVTWMHSAASGGDCGEDEPLGERREETGISSFPAPGPEDTVSLLQGHAPSPPLLAVTCLLPDPLGFLLNHQVVVGFTSHLPVCCSLCQEQSNRPSVPSPYLLSKAPLLHEQEPVAKGGRQARGQVQLTQGQ